MFFRIDAVRLAPYGLRALQDIFANFLVHVGGHEIEFAQTYLLPAKLPSEIVVG